MDNDLSQQIQTFALHLIEREAHLRPRKNKRSASEHEKFLLSTGWLCRKLLAVHAAHKGASTRISRDKNRYKAGRYVAEEVDVDWIISETEKYGSWTDRNPLWRQYETNLD